MTATIDRPPPRGAHRHDGQREGRRHRHGGLWIAAAVGAIIAIASGAALVYTAANEDGSAGAPDAVDELLDEFMAAMETNDYGRLRGVVTDGFRRPFYQGDADGSPWRDVWRIQAYEFWDEPKAPLVDWEIERVGDPIVRGDGPWFVSEAQIWKNPAVGIQYEVISTFAVVDEAGALKVDDTYWAGQATMMETDG